MNYAIILAVVATIAGGQLLFKMVGLRMGDRGFQVLLTDTTGAALFASALVLYGLATIGWVWALRQVPLSTAYLFMALGFIIVPVLAHFALGETLTWRLAAGSLLIVGGIALAATA